VTTNSIITVRPSTVVPTPNSTPPFCHQVIVLTTGFTPPCSTPLVNMPCASALSPSE
jgi:hypothetical protein